MAEDTAEVPVAAEALLDIMPEPVSMKKRTGFGTHFLAELGPESSVPDSAAECVETNSSKASADANILSVQKSGQVLVRTFSPSWGRNLLFRVPRQIA